MSLGATGGCGTADCPESRLQPVKSVNAVKAANAVNRMHVALMESMAVQASLEGEQIFQRHADEYGHSEIIVVEEGAKAGIAFARAYQPQLINEEHRPHP
jgi:hypothetical protein